MRVRARYATTAGLSSFVRRSSVCACEFECINPFQSRVAYTTLNPAAAERLQQVRETLKAGPQLKEFILEGTQHTSNCQSSSEPPKKARKIPEWIKAPAPTGEKYLELKDTVKVGILRLRTLYKLYLLFNCRGSI